MIEVKADPNMEGGGSGGGTQEGSTDNYYSSGDDGVRLTIIDMSTGRRAANTYTIDYFRKDKTGKSILHFGKTPKLEYMGVQGYAAAKGLVQSNEDYQVNTEGVRVSYWIEDMPIIVSSSLGNSDIDEIKDYFNNEARLKGIAARVGMSYEQMINGNYKLIIEPIIYLTFKSNYMALSAHESAKLDMALGGTLTSGGELRAKFVSFSHKNLPLAIFLKRNEMGVKKWRGSKEERVHNGDILEYLGIGILSFTPDLVTDIDGGDYLYRPDTDVISSVNVSVGASGNGATVDNPITVTFSGDLISTTSVTGIVIPPGESRLVWIKWHTPMVDKITKSTIHASITGGASTTSSVTLKIVIEPLKQSEPENPTADDKKPKQWNDNIMPNFPATQALKNVSSPVRRLSWHTYTCTKRSVWNGDYYEDEHGNQYPIYETVYDFTRNNYSASLRKISAVITPDKTVENANPNKTKIKSGYGIEMNLNSTVNGSPATVTGIQNAVVYFPEYQYKKYWRIGTLPGAALESTIQFPINQYSLLDSRIHFLPIWFPDKEYKVYIEIFDGWTPAGMLSDYTTASITVKGSMWDDYHIGIIPN